MFNITDQAIQSYVENHTSPDSNVCQDLRRVTIAKMEYAEKLSGKCSARLLKLLIQISQAKTVIDLGMFTGYSALSMAEALPSDGKVFTCDINPKAIDFAKDFFSQSEHGNKIIIQKIRALDLLENITEPVDLVFIDADKKNYPIYYQKSLAKIKSGGLVVLDNMLWSGEVIDKSTDRGDILDGLNRQITEDISVENVLLSIDDGLHIVRKR